LRGAGALAGLAVAVALVVALFPLWGNASISHSSSATPDVAMAVVDQAGMTRSGVIWAIRGEGLSVSRDHGRTWTEYEFPLILFSGPVAMTDANHVWVLAAGVSGGAVSVDASQQIYRSADGGATWNSTALPINGNVLNWQLRFVDNQIGFLVVGQGDGTTATGTIFRTEDGGVTWRQTGTSATLVQNQVMTTTQGPSGSPATIEMDQTQLDQVIPVDSETLWTYAYRTPASASGSSNRPLLRVSRDAGATWDSVSLPGLGSLQTDTLYVPGQAYDSYAGVQFLSNTEGYCAVEEKTAGVYEVHYFQTIDGGRTWNQIALTNWQQVTAAAVFVDATHWFQAGLGQETIRKAVSTQEFVSPDGYNVTSDGGKTWTNGGTGLGSLPYIWMSDTQYGAALISGVDNGPLLYLTSDGGLTWQPAQIGAAQWPDPTLEPLPSGVSIPTPMGTSAHTPAATPGTPGQSLPTLGQG
jgi:photosystem II stability/assembly factor-like uncharacterized protein